MSNTEHGIEMQFLRLQPMIFKENIQIWPLNFIFLFFFSSVVFVHILSGNFKQQKAQKCTVDLPKNLVTALVLSIASRATKTYKLM